MGMFGVVLDPGGLLNCPNWKKHDFLEDKNLLKHTKKYKNYHFLLQCGGLSIEIEAKVHMDTLGIHWGVQGAPKMAKNGKKLPSEEKNEKRRLEFINKIHFKAGPPTKT